MSRRAFLFTGLFWLALVGGLLGFKQFTLSSGEQVLLRTMPVDPRDLFRGDYVILRYEISSFPAGTLKLDAEDPRAWMGRRVYVPLAVEGGYGRAIGIGFERPAGLYLSGSLRAAGPDDWSVDYGIESYFVPEGAGRAIETRGGESLDVRVAIDRFGNAAIVAVLVDGEENSF